MTDRDEFDRIVEGLDLDIDLTFPAEPADPVREAAPATSFDDDGPVDPEEPFYRKVDDIPLVPRRRSLLLAWIGVAGAPLSLVIATVAHLYLPRPVLAGAVLIFVASAIFLFLQLPEHGPSRRDWPDDGAVL